MPHSLYSLPTVIPNVGHTTSAPNSTAFGIYGKQKCLGSFVVRSTGAVSRGLENAHCAWLASKCSSSRLGRGAELPTAGGNACTNQAPRAQA